MTYEIDDLHRTFGSITVDSALEHLYDGRVILRARGTDPAHLTGIVSGSGQAAAVSVRVKRDSLGRPTFTGSCTCMTGDCTHVPALLLRALNPESLPAEMPGGGAGLQTTENAPAVSSWMTDLLGLVKSDRSRLQPRGNQQFVLYIIDQYDRKYSAGRSDPHLTVERVRVRLLKRGGYSRAEQCCYAGRGPIPKYMTALDRRLFAAIEAARLPYGMYDPSAVEILSEDGPDLLEQLVATGRCHWANKDSPALLRGESLSGKIEWVLGNDGTQRSRIKADGLDKAIVLLTDPFWYVAPKQGTCGPLESDLPPRLAARLLQAPPLDPQAAEWARTQLDRLPEFAGFPLPEPLGVEEPVEPVEPVVHLRFHIGHPFPDSMPFASEPMVELSFLYDDVRILSGERGRLIRSVHGGKLRCMRRDPAFEAQTGKRLEDLGLVSLVDDDLVQAAEDRHPGQFVVDYDDTDISERMFDISMHSVPGLREAGWVVEFDENYPFRVVEAGREWYADVAPNEEQDWFDLELGIEIDGKRENLLPILVRMIRDPRFDISAEDLDSIDENETLLVPLGNRGFVPLPGKRVRAILGTLIELYGDDSLGSDDRLSLSAWNAPRLAELDEAIGAGTLHWAGGERLRELGRKLRDFSGLQEVPVPPGFRGTLRAYQQEGLNWLQFLREYGLSGILADDMGLGKTVQILAHLLVEKHSGRSDRPSLVVAPTSAMTNWFREAERFVPELRLLISHGPERKRRFGRFAEYDLVLTTYPLLSRDAEALQEQDWHFTILDEAQFVKNAATKAARSAAELNARHRLCVTGTPMENHLGELWSLFHILMPGLLGDRKRFGKLFRGPIEKHNDVDRRDRLVARIRPFMLRRTKDEVVLDLPPKTEMVRVVELQRGQRDLYESIRLAMHEKVRAAVAKKGMGRSTIVILDALLKLRQACCDPRLLKIAQAQRVSESVKLDTLLEMLDELMGEGRRVLLFSQFTSMFRLIEPELTKRGFSWVKLTGQTRDRDTPIRQFQDGEVPLFLISLKAGGTALNLTAADTVIHYDPWWNPAVEAQATDRAHRIGQDKPVFVYKLIAAGSVEEKMVAMQERKRKLAQGIYGSGGKQGRMFTAGDLESLFQPLG